MKCNFSKTSAFLFKKITTRINADLSRNSSHSTVEVFGWIIQFARIPFHYDDSSIKLEVLEDRIQVDQLVFEIFRSVVCTISLICMSNEYIALAYKRKERK